MGKPSWLDPHREEIEQMRQAYMSDREIAARFGVSESCVQTFRSRNRIGLGIRLPQVARAKRDPNPVTDPAHERNCDMIAAYLLGYLQTRGDAAGLLLADKWGG